MKERVIAAQEILADAGLYEDKPDGLVGPKTMAALAKYPNLDQGWGLERKIVAVIQMGCKALGIDAGVVDGYWGPATTEAFRQYKFYKEHNAMPMPWRPEERQPINPNDWPKAYSSDFDGFYGPPGTGKLVRLTFPYEMKLSWKPYAKVTSTKCHEKVAESAERVLEKVLKHYGKTKIMELRLNVFGGCYNKRPIRGGTKWSMHSWGVAFDFDPTHNKLKWGRDRATFAQPEYEKWWEFWEEEGWVSLGRERNFDWMHVQAAQL